MIDECAGDDVLWRYMDIPGFLWMLQRRMLFFTFPENFEDPFEGQFSKPVVDQMRQWDGESGEQRRRCFTPDETKRMAVSCWHRHAHENAAMWRAYGSHVGVAVRTRRSKLRAALPGPVQIRDIEYIDFETQWFDYTNVLAPYCYKRQEFSSEQEVRAIIWLAQADLQQIDCRTLGGSGVGITINPDTLIDEVVVGPHLASWFTESLSQLVLNLGYECPVKASRIGAAPYQLYHESKITVYTRWEDVNLVPNIPTRAFLRTTENVQGGHTQTVMPEDQHHSLELPYQVAKLEAEQPPP